MAVYLDMGTIVTSNFSREFEVLFCGDGAVNQTELREQAILLAAKNGVVLEDEIGYSYVEIRAYKKGDRFCLEGDSYDYSGWTKLLMMTQEEYNLLEGTEERLQPGEVLLFCSGPDFGYDSVWLEDMELNVKRELSESKVDRKLPDNTFDNRYVLVFADREQLHAASMVYGVDGYHRISRLYGFRPEGEEGNVDGFSWEMEKYVQGLEEFAGYTDHRENMREQESMYGGLLFIGIFFGSIFLICLLIIMYYKQITEGFEDQKNFEIMQKVGMDGEDIRRTVRRQISMVFGLPLVGALLHTAAGMHMVYMLLGAIGFFEAALLTACAIGGCIVFALVYLLSYRRTSMAYYRIVKRMN